MSRNRDLGPYGQEAQEHVHERELQDAVHRYGRSLAWFVIIIAFIVGIGWGAVIALNKRSVTVPEGANAFVHSSSFLKGIQEYSVGPGTHPVHKSATVVAVNTGSYQLTGTLWSRWDPGLLSRARTHRIDVEVNVKLNERSFGFSSERDFLDRLGDALAKSGVEGLDAGEEDLTTRLTTTARETLRGFDVDLSSLIVLTQEKSGDKHETGSLLSRVSADEPGHPTPPMVQSIALSRYAPLEAYYTCIVVCGGIIAFSFLTAWVIPGLWGGIAMILTCETRESIRTRAYRRRWHRADDECECILFDCLESMLWLELFTGLPGDMLDAVDFAGGATECCPNFDGGCELLACAGASDCGDCGDCADCGDCGGCDVDCGGCDCGG
ncbi:MAG: hypothetical protein KDD64_14555 [Bdellovibrionales bacterium]|nr:hypothetical protein [Bdellovibrionales bacterium]